VRPKVDQRAGLQ